MGTLIVPVVIKAILKNYIGKMARVTRILHIPNAYLLIDGAITGQAPDYAAKPSLENVSIRLVRALAV